MSKPLIPVPLIMRLAWPVFCAGLGCLEFYLGNDHTGIGLFLFAIFSLLVLNTYASWKRNPWGDPDLED